MSSCLDHALAYQQMGFAVLPLRGKRPDHALIQRTHQTASTTELAQRGATENQVREWFKHPSVNVGIFCGEPSGGLVVVDFDECDFPPSGFVLPETPRVKTGRGVSRGYHLYFKSTGPVQSRREGNEWELKANGYVVAPPSVHPDTGKTYCWELGLETLPLADVADLALPPASKNSAPNEEIRPTRDLLLGTCHRDAGLVGGDCSRTARTTKAQEGWLESFDHDTATVEAMAKALGITAPLGKPFLCLLHPEHNPSAALYRSAKGCWLYHDWHGSKADGTEWLTLATVRAARAGRPLPLQASEHATWKLVLLVEAGVLKLLPVYAAPLPDGTPDFARHVYERLLFLLGCRWHYTHGAPTALERRFAAALCEIGERLAREAIDLLHSSGAIYVAAKHGRTRLWLPAGVKT